MKNKTIIIMAAFLFIGFLWVHAEAQMMGPGSWGGGGYGPRGGGYGPWGGYGHWGGGYGPMMGGYDVYIPDKLPKPENSEWTVKLDKVYALEKLSYSQYLADEGKFQVRMPYMMVIPQEDYHIFLIDRLRKAYGIAAEVKTPPVTQSKTLVEAYQICLKLEEDLIPQYEWLIKNAEDDYAKEALDLILFQTRMHWSMFNHALQGGGMGPWGGWRRYR